MEKNLKAQNKLFRIAATLLVMAFAVLLNTAEASADDLDNSTGKELNGTYNLTEDIKGKEYIVTGETTINLKGHSIEGDGADIAFTVEPGQELTINNISDADGYIKGYDYHAVKLGEGSKLVMKPDGEKGGKVILTNNSYGAIQAEGNNIEICGGIVEGNTKWSSFRRYLSGGGIYLKGNDCKVHDIIVRNNLVERQGGALVAGADSYGGGIYAEGNDFELYSSVIESNNASYGGGLYLKGNAAKIGAEDKGNRFIKNSTFVDGDDGEDGGAVYIDGANNRMDYATCRGNYAGDDGGALYLDGSEFTWVDYAEMTANQAEDDGGAMYIENGAFFRSMHSRFINNRAIDGNGGALYDKFHTTQFWDCTINENLCAGEGGAISAHGNSKAALVLADSDVRFNDNPTDKMGAGILMGKGRFNVMDVDHISGNGDIKAGEIDGEEDFSGKMFSNAYLKPDSEFEVKTDEKNLKGDACVWLHEPGGFYYRTLTTVQGFIYSATDRLRCDLLDYEYKLFGYYRNTHKYVGPNDRGPNDEDPITKEGYNALIAEGYGLNKAARTNITEKYYEGKIHPVVSTPEAMFTDREFKKFSLKLEYREKKHEAEWTNEEDEWKEIPLGGSTSVDGVEGLSREAKDASFVFGRENEFIDYEVRAVCERSFHPIGELPRTIRSKDETLRFSVNMREGAIGHKNIYLRKIKKTGSDTAAPVYEDVLHKADLLMGESTKLYIPLDAVPAGFDITGASAYYDDDTTPHKLPFETSFDQIAGYKGYATVTAPSEAGVSNVYVVPEYKARKYEVSLKFNVPDVWKMGILNESVVKDMEGTYDAASVIRLQNVLNGSGTWYIESVTYEGENGTVTVPWANNLSYTVIGSRGIEGADSLDKLIESLKNMDNNRYIQYNLREQDNRIKVRFYDGDPSGDGGFTSETWDKGTTLNDHVDEFGGSFNSAHHFVECYQEGGKWRFDPEENVVSMDKKLYKDMTLYAVMEPSALVLPADGSGKTRSESDGSVLVYKTDEEDGLQQAGFVEGEKVKVVYSGDKAVKGWVAQHRIHNAGSQYAQTVNYDLGHNVSMIGDADCSLKGNVMTFRVTKSMVTPDESNPKKVSTIIIKPVLADPVINITGVPQNMTPGDTWDTSGAVIWPESVSDRSVRWTVTYDGETSELKGGFKPSDSGIYTLTVIVADGLSFGRDYRQDFDIEVGSVQINKYRVTFDANASGAKDPEDQYVTEGSNAAAPADPLRDGYTFDGWYKVVRASDGSIQNEEAFDFSSAITGDTELKAHWLCTVNISVMGNTGGSAGTVESAVRNDLYPEGSSVTVVATPDINYKVKRWTYNGNEVSGNTSGVFTINSLSAAKNEVTVEFEAGGGSAEFHYIHTDQCGEDYSWIWGKNVEIEGDDGKYAPGEAVHLTAIPDDGYAVHGWCDGRGILQSNSANYTFAMGNSDINVYAIVYNKVTDLNLTSPAEVTAGTAYTPAAEAEFADTEEDDDGRKSYMIWTIVSKPRNSEAVSYSGSSGPPTITSYEAGNIVLRATFFTYKPDVPTVVRYEKDFIIKVNPAEVETHNVVFKDGDKTVDTKTVEDGGNVSSVGRITKKGYRFEGWFNGETGYDFEQPVTSDLTLTAGWTKGTYVDSTASCTKDGIAEHYEIGSGSDKKYYTDDYMTHEVTADSLKIKAAGHRIDSAVYKWSDSNESVTATGICTVCGKKLSVTADSTVVSKEAATCTEPGEAEYSVSFSGEYSCFEPDSKTAVIPALGHAWSEPVYEWNESCTEVTATRHCQRADCKADPESETAAATGKKTKDATCTERGETTYTSGKFSNEAFKVQTKTVNDIEALGHEWGPWSDRKTDDGGKTYYKECSCTRTGCQEKQHLPVEKPGCDHSDCTVIPEIAPTCTAAGYASYKKCNECGAYIATIYDEKKKAYIDTVVSSDNLDEIRSKLTLDIDPDAHEWGEWTQTQAPTCSEKGTEQRICALNNSHVETREVDIDRDAHSWGAPEYEWNADYSRVTATRICVYDPAHHETETVSTTAEETEGSTCDEQRKTTYTSGEFTNKAFEVQTKTVMISGHAWGEPTYEWSKDNSEVTAKRVCKRDVCDAEETETVITSFEVIKKPTAKEKGLLRYTAVFMNAAFRTQTRDVPVSNEAEIEAAEKAARAAALEWEGTKDGRIPAAKSVKVKAGKKRIKVSWKKSTKKKLKKFTNVEIQVCTDKSFNRANTKRLVVKKSKKSVTVKKLAKKRTYYVRVRNVRGSGSTKHVSGWSKVRKVRTK